MISRLFILALLFTVVVVRADDGVKVEEVKKPSDTFSTEERASIESSQETFEFQAEVSRLMDILINSLYTNREIFIRELISNAADALDKVRYLALTEVGLLSDGEELGIKIEFNKKLKTLTITDKGVGMTRAELIKNLGIVAKSGTSDFLDAAAKDSSLSLIGQFGVGFYSVYLVADKVTVISKSANDDQHIWESAADSVFTISKDPRGNTLGRGTSIVLHLKEDAEEFMDEALLTKLVGRYSQFINFPIALKSTTMVDTEVALTPEELEEAKAEESKNEHEHDETDEENPDEEVDVADEEDDTPKTKTVKQEKTEWKVLNEAKPIWTKNPKDVTEAEYNEFYTSLTKDTAGALDKIHFIAEGEITFKAILYVPKNADPSIYNQFYEKSTGLKLYVRRVLISDEFDDFLPKYMNFIKGIVDSDDLPLNVSRETLAQSRVLKVMGKKLTRKVLEMLRKMADRTPEEDKEEDDKKSEKPAGDVEESVGNYDEFWGQYAKSIKMGVMEDKKNKAKLIKLLRFKSSKSNGKWTSFEQYVDRMSEDQANIYFLTCADYAACEANPVMEKFLAKGIEVLYMDQAIDEYCSQHIHEFDGIEPLNVMRESAQLPESEHFKALAASEDMQNMAKWFQTILGEKAAKIKVSNKLTTTPAACSAPEYGYTGNMERIMNAQALNNNKATSQTKKNFEFNPFHPIIKELNVRRKVNDQDQELIDYANILFDISAVVGGYTMDAPEEFAKRLHNAVSLGLGIDPKAKVHEEVMVPETEKDEKETTEAAEDVDDIDDADDEAEDV